LAGGSVGGSFTLPTPALLTYSNGCSKHPEVPTSERDVNRFGRVLQKLQSVVLSTGSRTAIDSNITYFIVAYRE
jgi:hypothetical protein